MSILQNVQTEFHCSLNKDRRPPKKQQNGHPSRSSVSETQDPPSLNLPTWTHTSKQCGGHTVNHYLLNFALLFTLSSVYSLRASMFSWADTLGSIWIGHWEWTPYLQWIALALAQFTVVLCNMLVASSVSLWIFFKAVATILASGIYSLLKDENGSRWRGSLHLSPNDDEAPLMSPQPTWRRSDVLRPDSGHVPSWVRLGTTYCI